MNSVELKTQPARSSGLSYKYQRLRERIRTAVASGELSGKLPGERELAQRFSANAKTLSKALTDLAAEGVLHRSIGRGTFVKGSENTSSAIGDRWLALAEGCADAPLLESVAAVNPKTQIIGHTKDVLRPSFINNFDAVIDLSPSTPATIVRDLLVRNIAVVTVGRESKTYSTRAVLADSTWGAAHLAREILSYGHLRFAIVEAPGEMTITDAVRRFVAMRDPNVIVDSCNAEQVSGLIGEGATACICDSIQSAQQTLAELSRAGISVPNQISVTALGWETQDIPCSGIYFSAGEAARAVCEILSQDPNAPPTTLWLRGTPADRGTIAAAPDHAKQSAILSQSRNSFRPFNSTPMSCQDEPTLARTA